MIINSQQRVRVSAPDLQRFLGEVQTLLRIPEGTVTVCLVPGQRIARWNRIYRGKAKPTDVLSFPMNESSKAKASSLRGGSFLTHPQHRRDGVARTHLKQRQNSAPAQTSKARAKAKATFGRVGGFGGAEELYLGDIAICPAVAQRNARSSNRALGAELRILILHGILHLLGYDHETDTGQMERRERKLRRRLGLE